MNSQDPESHISPTFRTTVQDTSPATLLDPNFGRTELAALEDRPAPRGEVHNFSDWRMRPEQTPQERLQEIKGNLSEILKLTVRHETQEANAIFINVVQTIRAMQRDDDVSLSYPDVHRQLGEIVAPRYLDGAGYLMLVHDMEPDPNAPKITDKKTPAEAIAFQVHQSLMRAARSMNGLGHALGKTRQERLQSAVEPYNHAISLISQQLGTLMPDYTRNLLSGVIKTPEEITFTGSKTFLRLQKLAEKYQDGVIPRHTEISEPESASKPIAPHHNVLDYCIPL